MKFPILSISTLLLLVFVTAITAQASPPDSIPVIQSEVGYTMPQEVVDAEIAGSVRIGVRVEESGKASKVWLISGPVWPCGKMPKKAIDKLADSLSDSVKTVKFTPGFKDGKPIAQNIALSLQLENPKVTPAAVQADPVTGKVSPKMASMGVLNGKAIMLPKPRYPAEAKAERAGGTVSVAVMIDEEGNVTRAGAVSGHPLLQYPARDAACGAKFSPTKLQGDPIKVSGVITYNFMPPLLR